MKSITVLRLNKILRKASALMAVLCLVTMLCGCSAGFFSGDLLTSPRLTDEQTEIYKKAESLTMTYFGCSHYLSEEDIQKLMERLLSAALRGDLPSIAEKGFASADWRYHITAQQEGGGL